LFQIFQERQQICHSNYIVLLLINMLLYALAVVVNECPCIIFRLYKYSCNIMFNHFLGELYEEVKVFSIHVVRARKGSRGIVQCHSLITLALDEGEWSALCPSHFYPWGKSHSCTGSWVVLKESGHFGEEKNLLSFLGFKRWIVQPILNAVSLTYLLHGAESFLRS